MRIAYFAHLNDGRLRRRREDRCPGRAMAGRRPRRSGSSSRPATPIRRGQRPSGTCRSPATAGPLSRLRAMARLVRAIRAFDRGIVYMRWDLFYPPMLCFPADGAAGRGGQHGRRHRDALGSRLRATYNLLTRGCSCAGSPPSCSSPPSWPAAAVPPVQVRQRGHHQRHRPCRLPLLDAPADGPPRLVFVGTGDCRGTASTRSSGCAAIRPGW